MRPSQNGLILALPQAHPPIRLAGLDVGFERRLFVAMFGAAMRSIPPGSGWPTLINP